MPGMSSSVIELDIPLVQDASITHESLHVELSDGRSVTVPLSWFPRLLHGHEEERNNWRLIGKGEGIHWDDLDEDISVENLLLGWPSSESQASLKKWLEGRSSQ